jgi:hypothetical protein
MKKNLTLDEFTIELERKNRELQLALDVNQDRIDNIRYLLRIGIEE